MGVPGLKSWVLKKCSPKRVSLLDWAAEGTSSVAPNIAIDAKGFAFFLYQLGGFDWLNGGQYNAFEEVLTRYLTAFERIRVEPFFFFDGNRLNEKKLDTTQERFLARENARKEIKKIIEEESRNHEVGVLDDYSSLLFPEYLIHHMKSILAKNNLRYFESKDEADPDIHMHCRSNRDACFGVWTNDSDMLCFDGIENVIFFEQITLMDTQKANGPVDICCRYFNQSNVLKNLGLPKFSLPTLVALAGNDFLTSEENKINSKKLRLATSKFSCRKLNGKVSKTALVNHFCRFLVTWIGVKNIKTGSELDSSISNYAKVPLSRFQCSRKFYSGELSTVDADETLPEIRLCILQADIGESPVHEILLPLRYHYYSRNYTGCDIAELSSASVLKTEKRRQCYELIKSSSLSVDTYPDFIIGDDLLVELKSCPYICVVMATRTIRLLSQKYIDILEWEWKTIFHGLVNRHIAKSNSEGDFSSKDARNTKDASGLCSYFSFDWFLRFRFLVLMFQHAIYYWDRILRSLHNDHNGTGEYHPFDFSGFDCTYLAERYENARKSFEINRVNGSYTSKWDRYVFI